MEVRHRILRVVHRVVVGSLISLRVIRWLVLTMLNLSELDYPGLKGAKTHLIELTTPFVVNQSIHSQPAHPVVVG